MPYRERSGDDLVCSQCGATTPSQAAPGLAPADLFVCAACLMRLHEEGALRHHAWEQTRKHAPVPPSLLSLLGRLAVVGSIFYLGIAFLVSVAMQFSSWWTTRDALPPKTVAPGTSAEPPASLSGR